MDHINALNNYIKATNTHDFTNVKELLSDKAIYWFTDKTCTSLEEIQAYFENGWDLMKDEVYGATDVKWLTVSDNAATCVYTFSYEGYQNGQFVEGNGRATNIFVKNEHGVWKLIHEHLSNFS
ncbi:ketosteroid isomerase-like protein [Salirhabdus euzebyi]|uniref:Ketosteroid isomerase-like protein n=1 Tax=Salirhabdus euzebyi TaxID=394506 RepID=A0A841Q5Z9_9BACI|nr:nuclear transport factor 2 family protein [Salirhabdus euzebyi]MBB6453777.1 ketosteroid isomerase-like protein [Salirhabdus euzebyi]